MTGLYEALELSAQPNAGETPAGGSRPATGPVPITPIYRLETAILERDGIFHVRAAARLDSTLHGTIAQERQCDSRQAAEITEGLLIDRINAAVRAIGAALDQAAVHGNPHGSAVPEMSGEVA